MSTLRFENIDKERLTPLMRQYVEEKESRPDCLIFMRLGDFYEVFFDDAVLTARELELKLTGRDCGLEERAPMCGVPHHAVDKYLNRLLERGYKIAICEQVEDPAEAKGLVAREVVRVLTPGTQLDPDTLDANKYSIICAVLEEDGAYGIAACDLSSGHFETSDLLGIQAESHLFDEIERFSPVEFVVNEKFAQNYRFMDYCTRKQITVSRLPDSSFTSMKASEFGIKYDEKDLLWHRSSAGLIYYLQDTQGMVPTHFGEIKPYRFRDYMILDRAARVNLELTETLRDRKRRGSLLWAVDHCKTAMGSRNLRQWLEQPLLNISQIRRRQDAVAFLKDNFMIRRSLADALYGLYDMERLSGRIASFNVSPRDLVSLRDTLSRLPEFHELLEEIETDALKAIAGEIHALPELEDMLSRALPDDPPIQIMDGGLIRDGYDVTRDELANIALHGQEYILQLEAEERERTGIKNLKVGYNRVAGYYIEVLKSQSDKVPENYRRRQTLTNSERYLTPELKEYEEKILTANQKLKSLEYEIFISIRETVAQYLEKIQTTARALARLDALISLAEVAERHNYCRPRLTEESILKITQGRHPVVEQILGASDFVPNDIELNTNDQRIMLLTGPNMSGKSTYMRQVALICILAQCGGFVPADSAVIGICDQIFTRVGASDDVSGGQSTFMVEMSEVATILTQATPHSLLILDEIGRGTSTADGLSIAWAVVEYLADTTFIGARSMFATHFHELIELSQTQKGVFNAHVDVAKRGGEIVFLHQIKSGGTDQSYGIEVSRLAGVPVPVVDRAREIMAVLEKANKRERRQIRKDAQPMDGQLGLFAQAQSVKLADEIIERLADSDPNAMSPIEAYSLLLDLKQLVEKQERMRQEED